MKMSTRSRYGLRLMVYLGVKFGNGSIRLNEVAEHEKISEKYLEQIVPYLKTAKLITSQRGSTGGYQLSCPPDKITLKEIIEPLEGSLILVDCTKKNEYGCSLQGTCATSGMWSELGGIISNFLHTTKLSDLVKTFNNKRTKTNNDMYYI